MNLEKLIVSSLIFQVINKANKADKSVEVFFMFYDVYDIWIKLLHSVLLSL